MMLVMLFLFYGLVMSHSQEMVPCQVTDTKCSVHGNVPSITDTNLSPIYIDKMPATINATTNSIDGMMSFPINLIVNSIGFITDGTWKENKTNTCQEFTKSLQSVFDAFNKEHLNNKIEVLNQITNSHFDIKISAQTSKIFVTLMLKAKLDLTMSTTYNDPKEFFE